jgi:hypothetical protein
MSLPEFSPPRGRNSGNARAFRLSDARKLFILRLRDSLQLQYTQARSSAGEHFLDAEGVGGSIPPVPTSIRDETPTILSSQGRSMTSLACRTRSHER